MKNKICTVPLHKNEVQNYIMSVINDCGDSIAGEIVHSFSGNNVFDISGNKLYTVMSDGRRVLNEESMKNTTKILLGYILRDYVSNNSI